jgi:uncharacterized surface protein with fasciclin (FAS1) repeats
MRLSTILLSAGLIAAPSLAQQDAPDLLQLAQGAGKFRTLLQAAEAAGLAAPLRGTTELTILAPTDDAFAALPEGALEGLLAKPDALRSVLEAHVLKGRVDAATLLTRGKAETLGGASWDVRIADGRVKIGGAGAVRTDLIARNGMIHAIDAVLLPQAESSADEAPTPEEMGDAIVFDAGLARVIAEERKAAADLLGKALDAGLAAAQLTESADDAATLLVHSPAAAKRLRDAAQAARSGGEATALDREVERVLGDLRFEPYVEAELPLGWPRTAPVGEVVLKAYPRYRMAKTGMAKRGGTTTPFFALFNHIKRNEIAMTAPVQMDYSEGNERQASMAFLYAYPTQGDSGQDARDDRVDVVDIAPSMAISIGGRGYEMAQTIATMRARLDAWLAANADAYEAAGPLRTMGYNSPMVPANRRYYEVEMPVRPVTKSTAPTR